MKKLLHLALLAGLLVASAPTLAQGPPSPDPISVLTGQNKIDATSSSARIALPGSSVAITLYNKGAKDLFFTFGSSSVTATTSSTLLPAGAHLTLWAGSNTYVAAITAGSDTATLVVYQANGPLQFGANAPATVLAGSVLGSINLNATALPAAQTGTVLQLAQADAVAPRVELDPYGTSGFFTSVRRSGTAALPTQVLAGEQIGGFNSFALDNAATIRGPIASFRTYAAENITSTASGSITCLAATPLTTSALADQLCVYGSTGVGIGLAGATTAPTAKLEVNGTVKGTSLALGGATIGTNALSVTGTSLFTGVGTFTTTVNFFGKINAAYSLNTTSGQVFYNSAAGTAVPGSVNSTDSYGLVGSMTYNSSSAGSGQNAGLFGQGILAGSGTANQIVGVVGIAKVSTNGVAYSSGSLYGGLFQSQVNGTSTVDHAIGIKINSPLISAATTFTAGLYIADTTTSLTAAVSVSDAIHIEGSGAVNGIGFGNGGSVVNANIYSPSANALTIAATSGVTFTGRATATLLAVSSLTTWANNQTCTAGQIMVDASFIYVCTAANTVKRATLSTF